MHLNSQKIIKKKEWKKTPSKTRKMLSKFYCNKRWKLNKYNFVLSSDSKFIIPAQQHTPLIFNTLTATHINHVCEKELSHSRLVILRDLLAGFFSVLRYFVQSCFSSNAITFSKPFLFPRACWNLLQVSYGWINVWVGGVRRGKLEWFNVMSIELQCAKLVSFSFSSFASTAAG